MGELTYVCEKLPTYVENDVDMWEMTEIYGKWLKYLTYGLNM